MTFSPRYYQIDADQAIADAFLNRHIYRQVIQLPTGTGKTVLFAGLPTGALRPWLESFPDNHRKIMIVAHREELLDQAADKLLAKNPNLIVDVEQASRRASPMADVVIASIQTLAARGGKRLDRFYLDQFRALVVDECHHAVAASYQSVLQKWGFLPPDEFKPGPKPHSRAEALSIQRDRLLAWDEQHPKDTLLLGVTATTSRGDNKGLEAAFQEVVYHKTLRDMIQEGFVCKLKAFRIESKTSLDEVHIQAGDFNIGELEEAVDNLDRNMLAVKAYQDYAPGRKALVFCVSVRHADDMAKAFNDCGIKAAAVNGGMSTEERKAVFDDFRHRRIHVLTNCQIATEGYDEPSIDCIIHARPTQSPLFYAQASGRGTRIAEGKENCIILDVVDMTRRHSLVSAPQLLGLPANFDPEGEDLLETAVFADGLKAKGLQIGCTASSLKKLQIHAEEVDLLLQGASASIAEDVKLTWVKGGPEVYYLSFPGNNRERCYVEIAKATPATWHISLVSLVANSQKIESTKTLKDHIASLADAFGEAESWLRKHHRSAYAMKTRKQPWQNDPMSPAQRMLLDRMKVKTIKPNMTKGEASLLLDVLYRRKAKGLAA